MSGPTLGDIGALAIAIAAGPPTVGTVGKFRALSKEASAVCGCGGGCGAYARRGWVCPGVLHPRCVCVAAVDDAGIGGAGRAPRSRILAAGAAWAAAGAGIGRGGAARWKRGLSLQTSL